MAKQMRKEPPFMKNHGFEYEMNFSDSCRKARDGKIEVSPRGLFLISAEISGMHGQKKEE